jgi:hypothetical protein
MSGSDNPARIFHYVPFFKLPELNRKAELANRDCLSDLALELVASHNINLPITLAHDLEDGWGRCLCLIGPKKDQLSNVLLDITQSDFVELPTTQLKQESPPDESS